MPQLKVKIKEKTQSNNALRTENLIPSVVYAKGEEAASLVMDYVTFDKLFAKAGESTLVDLVFPDESTKTVLIQDVQRDVVSDKIQHVDFYEVDLSKKVTANVTLNFTGEAPIVKAEGGIVMKHLDEVGIECLPKDLIKSIEVDLSGLTEFTSSIHVSDLKVDEKITITNNTEDVVVNVAEPKIVEEEAPVVAEGAEGAEDAEAKPGEEAKDGEAKPAGDAKPVEGGEKKE